MLTLRSFTFDQEKEMNEVLENGRLAAGSHVFVSEGKIIIPIEDGKPKNQAQIIIDVKEQMNTITDQMAIIDHSQKVLERLMKDATVRVKEAEANLAEAEAQKKTKKKYDDVKVLEERFKGCKSALRQLEDQKLQNEMEFARLTLNIEIFTEKLARLEK
jgi:hypothetical protein